jgi:hypothetical protein
MITKLAGYILVGSVATLAIAGVTGAHERYNWSRRAHRMEREFERHAEHARERRRERHRDRRHERRIEVVVGDAQAEIRAAEAEIRVAEAEVAAAVAEATAEADAATAGVTAAADVNSVVGSYVFDADGAALGKFPWSARAVLELLPAGRFELRVKANLHDEVSEEATWGRYKVQGNHLILYSPHDDGRFEFLIRGDRLEFDAGFQHKLALKVVGLRDAALIRQR